mmetsp:Transcript_30203/g.42088  ORF Transcript_30203/g.42088 Transcript_30203/m.42088 type:complete len:83 (+) Transcript_30203:272-520(+)
MFDLDRMDPLTGATVVPISKAAMNKHLSINEENIIENRSILWRRPTMSSQATQELLIQCSSFDLMMSRVGWPCKAHVARPTQ